MIHNVMTGTPLAAEAAPVSKYRRTVDDYARATGLPVRTIRDMCQVGELRATKKRANGRRWYIHDSEFDKLLKE